MMATTIEVRSSYSYEEPVTTQIIEDGELIECNHAGAQEEEMEFEAFSWWEDAHTIVPDDSTTEIVMVCDKSNCRAWQDQDGLWRND